MPEKQLIGLEALRFLSTLAIAGLPVLVVVVLFRVIIRPRSRRVTSTLTILGDLTCASDRLHFPIEPVFVLVPGFYGVSPIEVFNGHALVGGYVTTTLIAARIAFGYFERPAQQYLRALLRAWPATPPDVALAPGASGDPT